MSEPEPARDEPESLQGNLARRLFAFCAASPFKNGDLVVTEFDLDRPIWGARAIGTVLNLTERQTFHMLDRGLLPATKIGKLWVSTPRRLLDRVAGEQAAA